MRRLTIIFLLLCCLTCAAAAEDGDAWVWEGAESFFDAPLRMDANMFGVPKKTTLPVWAAPYDGAYRGAKGKASVSLAEPTDVLAQTPDNAWLLIHYRTSKKENRVGWIQPPSWPEALKTAYLTEMDAAEGIVKVMRDTKLTDDPTGGRRTLRTIRAGETLGRLAEAADGGRRWVYVQAEVDGKPAYGFVPAEDVSDVPLVQIEGDTLVVSEGVTMLGSWIDHDSGDDAVGYVRDHVPFGTVSVVLAAEDLGFWDEDAQEWQTKASRIRLPSTLRILGGEALQHITLEELTLPEGVTGMQCADVFYGGSIGTLRLPASFGAFNPAESMDYCAVGTYEVSPDNPQLKSVDGVLFSKDGRRLICYPSGRRNTHYDVPKGTETIGRNAFIDSFMENPLVTISLPMGLKTIESRAFACCGRLISLSVPPTVTALAEDAFADCVSLERLSLPAAFSASLSDWVEPADFTFFNGDNGETLRARKSGTETEEETEEAYE